MNNKMPRTPFSLPLSGSARETEIRLRNIFSGPKKRPPLPFLILMFAIAIFCGNLVSCQQRPAEPTLIMAEQYYDSYGNYLELPALVLPEGEENEAVDAINAGLAELGARYEYLKTNEGVSQQCTLYPSTTNRYINLVFFEADSSYGNDGYIRTWVYDKQEGTQVTEEDALGLAGTNRAELFSQLEATIASDPEDPRELYQLLDPIGLQGFRIRADGKPVFYLAAMVDGRELESGGYLDEWLRLYIWEDGSYTRYPFSTYREERPLVPAEETDQLDPPLWNQWYFSGGEPEGGFVSRYVPGADPYGINFYNILLEQYAQYQDEWNVFYADSQQDTDKAGDLRVAAIDYLGEVPWGKNEYAAAYLICYTFYVDGPRGLEWHANHEVIVLGRSAATGGFTGLLGRMDYEDRMQGMSPEEVIQEAAGTWQSAVSQPDSSNPGSASVSSQEPDGSAPSDPEVCLYRDGYSTPIGLGNWVDSMFQDFEPETSVFEEGDPIYWPGDYWENWSVDGGGDAGGVSALRYYSAESGSFFLNRLETGRTDMVTPRGIRVGASREEVLAAYPGLLSDEKDWTWAYPDDYLWYCANEDGIGPHLYFYFVNDVVYMIQMVDLFN